MTGLKIASKRAHLGFGGSNSDLEEDEGLRRRTSAMEVKTSWMSWRNPMGGN